MQFERRKRLKITDNVDNLSFDSPYPFWINFYKTPPNNKVLLQDIEDMVSERLRILQIIDIFKSIENKSRNKEFYETVISQINSVKHNNERNFYVNGRSTNVTPKVLDARRRDHVSHFLLRLYYCQTEQLRRWFISRETELFKIRLIDSTENCFMLQDCLEYYGFKYEIIDCKDDVDLHGLVNWFDRNRVASKSFVFKLPFEEALDLVRTRKVYLKDGFAFISSNEMISVFCSQFRLNLSKELTKMWTEFYSFNEERLISRLDSLHQNFIAKKMKKSSTNEERKDAINCEMIDQLAQNTFPPCMRAIHETLRKEHHLKHYARLYYGLFLKSCGLSLDDAIEFFRSEFSIQNPEKFQKEYSYTIRYIYGKEGKRVQLSPYSCAKIVHENAPGPTDCHGCPFRHYDLKNLRAMLIRYGVNQEADLEAIIELVKSDRNYVGACAKYFNQKFEGAQLDGQAIYHPNQFFREARKFLTNGPPKMPIKPLLATDDQMPNDLDVTISSEKSFNEPESLMEVLK